MISPIRTSGEDTGAVCRMRRKQSSSPMRPCFSTTRVSNRSVSLHCEAAESRGRQHTCPTGFETSRRLCSKALPAGHDGPVPHSVARLSGFGQVTRTRAKLPKKWRRLKSHYVRSCRPSALMEPNATSRALRVSNDGTGSRLSGSLTKRVPEDLAPPQPISSQPSASQAIGWSPAED